MTFLSGLSRKLDVFLSASTSCLTDIMKPRSNVEPGRDEQRFPADQKNESWDIPLPARWEFILSYDRYLSTDTCPLILQTQVVKTIVAAGGFSDATQIESPNPDTGTSHLEASREKAGTKMFLQWDQPVIQHCCCFTRHRRCRAAAAATF